MKGKQVVVVNYYNENMSECFGKTQQGCLSILPATITKYSGPGNV